jgi:predicted DCC family thiol-disulfide oxidoreductase YuxK
MILLYDGQCGFCKKWVAYVQTRIQKGIQFFSYQDKGHEYPHLKEDDFQKKVHLIDDDTVWVGAAAVYKVVSFSKWWGWLWWMYCRIPGFNCVSEWGYSWVASHRSRVSEWLFPPLFNRSVSLFFKGLGFIYIVAFGSLISQVQGLFGSHGIVPIASVMASVHQSVHLPTLFWVSYSDAMITMVPVLGTFCGMMMVVSSRYLRFWSVLAWILYLSIVNVGHVFMMFQWDVLLLEVGFLVMLLNPNQPSRLSRFLFQWLLFRLMFASGLVKLMSGDASWKGGALTYHYWTQPLPHVGSWWVHQLPDIGHKLSMGVMFVVELIIPWFIFGSRRYKRIAFGGINGLMIMVTLTGNYGFFNLLVMVITLFLLDDDDWKWVGGKFYAVKSCVNVGSKQSLYSRWLIIVVGSSLFFLSFPADLNRFLPYRVPFSRSLLHYVQPFHIVNGYGLFAVMTKTRPELIIQGSWDNVNWKSYQFKWKTNDVNRRPQWSFPYHPRLDWQLWFAALGSFDQNQWLYGLLNGLGTNNPHIVGLLKENPFSERGPVYLRIVKSNYTFTTVKQWRETGQWWNEGGRYNYSPVFKLNLK